MPDIDIPPEVRLKYLERRKTDFENCQKAIQNHDFESLARIGHQIKGNAATFGFDDLSEIAINLEDSALKKDLAQLNSIMHEFSKFLAHTH